MDYEKEYNQLKNIKEHLQTNVNVNANPINLEEYNPLENDLYKFKGKYGSISDINDQSFQNNVKLINNSVREKHVDIDTALKQLYTDRKLDILNMDD